jgi:hypothetical protein
VHGQDRQAHAGSSAGQRGADRRGFQFLRKPKFEPPPIPDPGPLVKKIYDKLPSAKELGEAARRMAEAGGVAIRETAKLAGKAVTFAKDRLIELVRDVIVPKLQYVASRFRGYGDEAERQRKYAARKKKEDEEERRRLAEAEAHQRFLEHQRVRAYWRQRNAQALAEINVYLLQGQEEAYWMSQMQQQQQWQAYQRAMNRRP